MLMDDRSRELLERIARLEEKLERLEERRGRAALGRRLEAVNPWLLVALACAALAIPLAVYASNLSVPYVFVNGTVADADQVNANFAAVEAAVDDNDARITALEGALASAGDITAVLPGFGLSGGGLSADVTLQVNSAQTQVRVAGTCAPGSSIRAIDQIGAVTCQTDSVGTGDITAVSAGAGLTGGGSLGDVTLSIATSAVTSGMIEDGTIVGADVSPGATFTLGGLTVDGPTVINGLPTFTGGSPIRIHGNFSSVRWFDATGTTEHARLVTNPTVKYLFDYANNRYVFSSFADGVGIGTGSPVANAAVTVPSLDVTGSLYVGYEQVSTSVALSTSSPCPSHGNLTCYFGEGTAVCPAGTRVLGGGISGSAALGGVGQSYPSGLDRWSCSGSHDLPGFSFPCYAICARIES
jgi:hypothetical protein